MQRIKGAKVDVLAWADPAEIESVALDQLRNIASLPWVFHHVAAMADVHFGKGATVGSVIAMKDAVSPAAVGVDIGCFAGDTAVALASGRTATLRDLEGQSFVVYSCTPSGRTVMSRAVARKTRTNAPLVRMLLDSGEQIRCTPDHLFLLRNGGYCRADRMGAGTSLMPLYTKPDKEGYTLPSIRSTAASVQQNGYNHSVVAVEPVDEREDVYCLAVEEHGNFALAAGVFVHNCGMAAVQTSLTSHDLPDSLHGLRSEVERAIPVGFESHKLPIDRREDRKLWEEFDDLTPAVRDLLRKARSQLGTLGGGNHFIELCLDTDDRVWLMLHSGSRNIGKSLAEIHIGRAKKLAHNQDLPDRDLAVFLAGTEEMEEYRRDLFWAQRYARANREAMLDLYQGVLRRFRPQVQFEDAVHCHHNYVAEEVHFGEHVLVTRKGAIRAGKGDLGIIPGSMGTRSFIVRGLGNSMAFDSASHGAGRKMSRGQARKRFSVNDLREQTKGVECRKDGGVLDEIPSAYKDINKVMEQQKDLVEVVAELRQVLCVKG
jgi:tRNA-splicing ligase RtcB (3'-phosphate/5'-hydroxy nucleic acid ligase)